MMMAESVGFPRRLRVVFVMRKFESPVQISKYSARGFPR